MKEDIQKFVKEEKAALEADRESISEAVLTRSSRGLRVAIGLLALNRPSEAIKWFEALAPEFVRYADGIAEHKFNDQQIRKAQRSPWYEYQRGLQSAIMGHTDPEPVAERAFEWFSKPYVDEFEHRETEPRIDLVGTLSSYFVDSENHVTCRDQLRQVADGTDDPYHSAYYIPQAEVLAAIDSEDSTAVTEHLESLLEFHEEFVIDAVDARVVDEAVAFETCVYLVLARQHGLPIHVDSEYIPEALYDEDHYPLGGN